MSLANKSTRLQTNSNLKLIAIEGKQLIILLQDIFMAGTETTSSTLAFITYYLMQNPEVQKNIHAELDRELGIDEIPTMDHRNRYPSEFKNCLP